MDSKKSIEGRSNIINIFLKKNSGIEFQATRYQYIVRFFKVCVGAEGFYKKYSDHRYYSSLSSVLRDLLREQMSLSDTQTLEKLLLEVSTLCKQLRNLSGIFSKKIELINSLGDTDD